MVKKIAAFFFSTSLCVPSLATKISTMEKKEPAPTLSLSPQWVAERIVRLSATMKESRLRPYLQKSAVALAESSYDTSFSFESGYEKDKTPSVSSTADLSTEKLKTVMTLKKPWTTGTLLQLDLSHTSSVADQSPYLTNPPDARQTAENFTLRLEQSLWKNSFGKVDRAQLKAAKDLYASSLLAGQDDLENVILQGLRLYWQAYVAQENFQEALRSRQRYAQLVETVKKKNANGYANPGELNQVQAEYHVREANVRATSLNYLQSLDQLGTFIEQDFSQIDPVFEKVDHLAELPELKSSTTDLRTLRFQQLRVQWSDSLVEAARSRLAPDLALVASFGSSGLDTLPSQAVSETLSLTQPKYYLGLKFAYNFGSDIQKEDLENKLLQRELEKTILHRREKEVEDQRLFAEEKIKSTRGIAEHQAEQVKFREQAVQEIQRSYQQGRVDISQLIDALNRFFAAEIQYTQAVGDYQMSLNEWAAFQDQLITPSDSLPGGSYEN